MPAETSVALGGSAQARAYALPARLGDGDAGVKWTAHRAGGDGWPAIVSLTTVSDAATGLPIGLVESASLTATRTAAVSGLALQHGASAPVRRVALLGAGVQAAAHLRMLAALFPGLDEVTCWNRTPERPARDAGCPALALARYCRRHGLTRWLPMPMPCSVAPRPPLRCWTRMPCGRAASLSRPDTMRWRSTRSTVPMPCWSICGGLSARPAPRACSRCTARGAFPPTRVAADLPELVLDGWRPPRQASVYFSSFGLNLFDIALAGRVLRDASARGIGDLLTLEAI